MFPWYVQFSWRDLSSCNGTLCSVGYIFPILPCLLHLFFSQLFIKPPQTTTFLSCVSFSLEWFWSPPLVQCYKLPSIVLQALCLPDLNPWIYWSPPLYNHKGFDLGNTWMSTKVHLVKAIVFLVVIYGCESWTIKRVEHRIIDAFELWFWRRLLRVPWTAKRSNQSILKEISPEYSWKDWCWSWNSNTLATWGEELTHWKRLMLGKIEGRRRRGWQRWDGWMASLTQWTWVWASSGSWWWTRKPGVLQYLGWQRVGHDWVTEQNWSILHSLPRLIPYGKQTFPPVKLQYHQNQSSVKTVA